MPVELREFLDPGYRAASVEFGPQRRHHFDRREKLSLALFLATCVSTFFAGCNLGDLDGGAEFVLNVLHYLLVVREWPQLNPQIYWNGLTFSACLMLILLAHEMGHFLLALRHKVHATWPFFVPLPVGPFGTLGAVILQDARSADRRQMFDIAIAGPLAGLIIALPVLIYGVSTSQVFEVIPMPGVPRYGDPLLVRWIVAAIHGSYGPGQDIAINAPLFAGWVGIFITALNLLPVGQFDGGHILYTLIGRKAHYVAYTVLTSAVIWMVLTQRLHYVLIVILLFVFGPKHPPTANDHMPLGWFRIALGWLTLAFIIIGFTPTPIMM